MKKCIQSIFFLLVLSLLVSCESSEEKKRKMEVQLMSTQTLGLAYLEEMKLEEAETEFKKFIELAPDEKLGYANLGLVYLRMGKYEEAEARLSEARSMDESDPEVNLLLATTYRLQGRNKDAIQILEKTLESNPDHPKVLFELSELYGTEQNAEALSKRQAYLERLTENTPGNLVPMILLVESSIKLENADRALAEMEKLPAQFPEFPAESMPFYRQTLEALQAGDTGPALIPFTVFHNYQKVTYPYQAGMTDLKGPVESALGIPLINYSETASMSGDMSGDILESIRFTEVAESAGLRIGPLGDGTESVEFPVHHAVGDYDGDGDMDLYIGRKDEAGGEFKSYLFQNELGRYQDFAESYGIQHNLKENRAAFADFDNDGFLDLLILGSNGAVMYHNAGKGNFVNMTDEAGLSTLKEGSRPLFVDLDHDGDLDLFQARDGLNQVFLNTGDRGFKEVEGQMGLGGAPETKTNEAIFGDFDDDGDLDLYLVNANAPDLFAWNQRQGAFKTVEVSGEMDVPMGSKAAVAGDFNNDGLLDLALVNNSNSPLLMLENQGEGAFISRSDREADFQDLRGADLNDLEVIDFDNDGYLDLVLAGASKTEADRGVYLYHNKGDGSFENLSRLLPEIAFSASQISTFDYNEDGDSDLLLSGLNGEIFLLRNDGGNRNHYLNMKLVGLRTGSAKNNYFGIGSKVEMRAGDLYQSAVVTQPEITFGLGNRSKADVIRITWTNGVPQNIVLPDANQNLIEEQTLKGSCPFLYAWNGEAYVFVKDITWRSALGMPLGIMGEDMSYAFADASDDYLLIEGEHLKPKDGSYSLKITSELWETIYMDRLRLVVVDHPDSVKVFVPEQFSPPPFPGMELHQVANKVYPVSAWAGKGLDVLDLLTSKDDRYVSQFYRGKYQGLTEMHELVIDPGPEVDLKELKLFLRGWIFPTDASINFALSQSNTHSLRPPSLEVLDQNGNWRTAIDQIGFPMGKDKTVIVDLSGKITSKDRRIRIKTNMEIYWDEIFFSSGRVNAPLRTTILDPDDADLQYRGFSRSYRKGGRHGPHWFDYASVSKDPKWNDLTGNYTRFGDVLELLNQSDNQYVISNAGDEMSVHFNAESLPKLKKGWKRDFLIHSVGWVKDGDMNTAEGSTVEPLPFHGMKSYPPSADDAYPATPEILEYHKRYNTRVIDRDSGKESLVQLSIKPEE